MRLYIMAILGFAGLYLMLGAAACAIDHAIERGRTAQVVGP